MSETTLTPSAVFALPGAKVGINPWFIAITVPLATFIELLDTAIANVALPHIAGGLAVSADESTWVLTSYLVSNAVVLPLSAWLSRLFGRKRYYMICVAVFTVSSLLCGFAPSLGALIFFRILQGVGGGGLAPVEQAIIVDTFSPAKRAAAFALYSMAIVRAPAIGPPLGGWITCHWDWRGGIFMNMRFGIVLGLALYGSTVLIPQMLQRLFGYTATDAGLVLGPGAFVIVMLAPLVVRILPKIGVKWLIGFGYLVFALAMWYYASFTLATDYRHEAWARALQGLGIATLFVPVSQLAYSNLPKNKNNKASSLTNLFRNQGGSFGIAFVTTLLARRTQYHESVLVAHTTPLDERYRQLLANLCGYYSAHGFTVADAAVPAQAPGFALLEEQAGL